jgi:hypothetical protein
MKKLYGIGQTYDDAILYVYNTKREALEALKDASEYDYSEKFFLYEIKIMPIEKFITTIKPKRVKIK